MVLRRLSTLLSDVERFHQLQHVEQFLDGIGCVLKCSIADLKSENEDTCKTRRRKAKTRHYESVGIEHLVQKV
ncbi:hypothetical protein V6N13_096476 [Hibiscus sabdariffa]